MAKKRPDTAKRSLGETGHVLVIRPSSVVACAPTGPFPGQKTEARVGCSALNRMTRLGMQVCGASS